MVGKLRSRLHGKAASYLVNAYIDAKIEEALVLYAKKGKFKILDKEVEERVKKIIAATPINTQSQRLIVKAFVYKRINGYANYWYSKLIYLMAGMKLPQEKSYYLELDNFFDNPLIHLTSVVFFYRNLLKKYALQKGIKLLFKKSDIKNEILLVQKLNILENEKNALKIKNRKFDTWKTRKLLEWSKSSILQKEFLKSAELTQMRALWWDKIYSCLLTRNLFDFKMVVSFLLFIQLEISKF